MIDDSTRGGASVLGAALAVGPNRNADLLQHSRLGSALPQTAPSDDGGAFARVQIASSGQADRADHVGESDRRVQGENGNVVVLQRTRASVSDTRANKRKVKGRLKIAHQGPGVETTVSDQSLNLFLHVLRFRVGLDIVVAKADGQS